MSHLEERVRWGIHILREYNLPHLSELKMHADFDPIVPISTSLAYKYKCMCTQRYLRMVIIYDSKIQISSKYLSVREMVK